MKEKLYAIPVNDAFKSGCECPVCMMYNLLETNAIEYTMGPSYMEDDIRAMTDKAGFCNKHMNMMYESGNKLGISLMLKTHFDHVIRETKKLSVDGEGKKSLFKKNDASSSSPMVSYLKNLNNDCFVCNRIENVFTRYIDTIFHLWKTDPTFKESYGDSKGFCNEHFCLLIDKAPEYLKAQELNDFLQLTKDLYISNMERVRDDLAWFSDKFDYRNNDAPWKNSKDAIPRAMIKTSGIILPDDK